MALFALSLCLYSNGTEASAPDDFPPRAPDPYPFSVLDAYQTTLAVDNTGAWLRWANGAVSVQGANYQAILDGELSQRATIEYRYKDHRLGLRPVGLTWRLSSGREVPVGHGVQKIRAKRATNPREIEGGGESSLRENGLIYENAYGKGIHLGVLARDHVLRKIVRLDHLADLGEIPSDAEFLELPFVIEAEPGTHFAARFGGEAIHFWDRKETVITRGEAVEFGKGVHRSFFLPAQAWDSSGSRIPLSLELKAVNGKLYLTKRIPVGWVLQSAFPVFADVDLSFGAPVVFQSMTSSGTSVATLDSTHVVIAYQWPARAVVGTITGNTITFGAPTTIDPDSTDYVTVTALDSTHVVVAFRDDGNSGFGTAVVGTISGGTITFGTSVVFESASTSRIAVTTLDSNHVVIAYSDGGNSNFGTAIVGTISGGDTIAFGSPVVFESAFTSNTSATALDSTHTLIAYRDDGNGGAGTAIVGTISGGNTISFGTVAVFNAASTAMISAAALDSTHVAIGYQDRTTTADPGTAIVATISGGDNIAYGAAVVFEVDRTANIAATVLDANRVVFAYTDLGHSNFGKAIVGTVSGGDVLTFGNAVVYEAASTGFISAKALDSRSVVITYRDNGNSGFGTAVVGETVGTLCCLIGFETGDASEVAAPGAGSSVQSATVRTGSGAYSLKQASAQTTLVTSLPPEFGTVAARFSFRKPANPPSRQTLLQFLNGGTNLWTVGLTTAGQLHVQQDETMGLAPTAGSTPLNNDAWYTVRLVYDSAAGGVLRVWLDGTLEIDITHASGGSPITEIRLEGLANPNEFFYDDFWVSDTTSLPPLGQIVPRSVVGPGNLSEFDTEGGVPGPPSAVHYENVDEFSPNDDTDFNQHTASAPATDLYGIMNHSAGGINAVKAMFRMKHGNGGNAPNTHHYAWRENGLNASQEFPNLGTSWETGELYWMTPPNSGRSWTAAKFDGLELGARHNNNGARDTFISWTTAMVDYDPMATEVTLVSFSAVGHDGEVSLEWETASELENLGFHLYRADSEEGTYERITASAIPGLGSSPVGARYSYRDSGLTNGVTYYYKLEDIESTGKTKLHGPVFATPEPGVGESGEASSDSSPAYGDSGTSPARITYGDPSANGLRVLKRDRDHVVLELRTEGFYAEPQEDGTVRVEIPGFEEVTETGLQSIPVKRTWVEAIAGRKVKLVSVRTKSVESIEGLKPSGVEVAELEATRRGTVRAVRQRRGRRFQEAGWYPEKTARIVSVGFQGEVKKALLELAPVRWDGERLRLARYLTVRLSFRGREVSELTHDGERGRRFRRRTPHAKRRLAARFVTEEEGLYGVDFEEVFGGSHAGIPASSLRLSRQGEAVVFHLEPDESWFRPGATLYFVGDGADANPYGSRVIYELEVGKAGAMMPVVSAAPTEEDTPYYWHRVEKEENHLYQATLLGVPDPWLWSALFAPATKRFPFEVSGLATTPEDAHLTVSLQGASDFDADPDHHVRLYMNGSFVGETSWNGKNPHMIEAALAAGILQNGINQLDIENVGDTEARYSMVMLNRFRVVYPRLPMAVEGRLEGVWSVSGTAHVSGMSAGAVVVELSKPDPVWLTGAETTAGGLRFRAEAGRSYLATSSEAVLRVAEVQKPFESTLKSTRNRADYLVIGPREFLEAATPLLELRRSQGLRVKAVPIEEIYSEFGFGESTPESIGDFIAYAYHLWRKPSVRYVLLLGDATYDYKDYLGTGVENQVPPLLLKTTYLWTVSDPAYASVNGEDLLPDLSIGRLPAASVDVVRTVVEKIVAYETGAGSFRAPVVLVTDNPDRGGDFQANAEELASSVLTSQSLRKIYLSELGTAATRAAIVEAFDEGASLLSYIGHGGIQLWAEENLLNIWQVDSFSPQSRQPLVLTMNCLNGYFHFPHFDSLAEKLLKLDGKGAIAVFSPSGLSLNAPAHLYHKALLTELFHGGHQRLGDAVLAAQETYADTGAFPELLSIYHLLGDPALTLHSTAR